MSTQKNYVLKTMYITYVYILTAKDNKIVKVGTTINPKKRIIDINKKIKLDLTKSFIVPCLRIGEYTNIERDIKEEFKEHRVKGLPKFDGSTEFYKIEQSAKIFYKIYSKSTEKKMIKIKDLKNLPPKLYNNLDKEEKKNNFYKNLCK